MEHGLKLDLDPPPDWASRAHTQIARWPLIGVVCLVLIAALLSDHAIAAWARTLPPVLREIAPVLTALGTSGYMFAGSALVAFAAWWLGRSTRKSRLRAKLSRVVEGALYFFLTTAAAGLLVQIVKRAVGRVRPRIAGDGSSFTFHPFTMVNGYASFPSGHAASSFAAATALGLIVPRWRVAFYLAASAIAVCRIVENEHYASDVVSGAVLGLTVSLTLARAPVTTAAIRGFSAWADKVAGPADRPERG